MLLPMGAKLSSHNSIKYKSGINVSRLADVSNFSRACRWSHVASKHFFPRFSPVTCLRLHSRHAWRCTGFILSRTWRQLQDFSRSLLVSDYINNSFQCSDICPRRSVREANSVTRASANQSNNVSFFCRSEQ